MFVTVELLNLSFPIYLLVVLPGNTFQLGSNGAVNACLCTMHRCFPTDKESMNAK